MFGAAVIVSAVVVGAACPALAQSRYDADRRDDGSNGYADESRGRDFQDRHESDGRESYGRESYGREGYGGEGDRRYRDDHDQYRQDYDNREAYGYRFQGRNARHFCWYESGWRGRGSYWCGYAWRTGYGWAGDDEGNYYYGGNHYRGYWEDGTGRRTYDRGGRGVGHDDYTRDYNPLRGY